MTENGRRSRVSMLTSNALLGLMRIAAAPGGRTQRTGFVGGSHATYLMSGDDVQELIERKLLEADGTRYLAITQKGNGLVRHLLEVAKSYEPTEELLMGFRLVATNALPPNTAMIISKGETMEETARQSVLIKCEEARRYGS